MIRPLIGGTFSNPAQKYPSWFGSYFFEAYPYFLPCFVVTCITLASIIWGYFYLDEVRFFIFFRPIYAEADFRI